MVRTFVLAASSSWIQRDTKAVWVTAECTRFATAVPKFVRASCNGRRYLTWPF